MWYKGIHKFVIENGGKISVTDPALYMWHENEDLMGVIYVHVDDFLCSGTNMFFQNIIFKLCKTFSVGKEENNSFRYLGLNISKNKNNFVTINQSDYINQLNKIIIEPSRKHQHLDPVTPN